MKIGKREQFVLVSLGTLLSIFLVHILIFRPKSLEYEKVLKEYQSGVALVNDAEIPPSPNYIKQFNVKTQEYDDQVSSIVALLNLNVPRQYMRKSGEPERVNDTVELLQKLMEMRATMRQPSLSFLDDRRANPNDLYSMQQGWDLPQKLPNLGPAGALWDNVAKLQDRYVLMNAIQNTRDRLMQRPGYNEYLAKLGINPAETSDWVIDLTGGRYYVFFNDMKLAMATRGSSGATGAVPNPLSINRFGVLLPVLKRLWTSELIWAQHDQNTQITKEKLRDILEVDLPMDHALFSLNKQLLALVDIIEMAQRDGIIEISQVYLMKPAPLGKTVPRVPGQSPTPKPTPQGGTPAPMAGMPPGMDPTLMGVIGARGGGPMMMGAPTPPPVEDKVGAGTGIELYFKASNSNSVKFLFDITHMPRTYSLDDLAIYAQTDGSLVTTTTVEIVTNLD